MITDGELPMGAFRTWKKIKDWEFPKIAVDINVDKIRLKKNSVNTMTQNPPLDASRSDTGTPAAICVCTSRK